MTAKDDAEVMLELIEHPERFCLVCYKRIGVCKHTRARRRQYGKNRKRSNKSNVKAN